VETSNVDETNRLRSDVYRFSDKVERLDTDSVVRVLLEPRSMRSAAIHSVLEMSV